MRRHLFCVGQADALAVLAAEGPEVEGTLDVVADHVTTHGEVGAKVRAVGVWNEWANIAVRVARCFDLKITQNLPEMAHYCAQSNFTNI